MSSSTYNSRNGKQNTDEKQQHQEQYLYQHQYDQERDLYKNEELPEHASKQSRHRSNYERKFKQIESVDEEAQINRQIRLQQKYSQQAQDPHSMRHLRHHSNLVKTRKPLIIENAKIKHKLKKRNATTLSPRTSSSSFHSTSVSPVTNTEKDKPDLHDNETLVKVVNKQQSSNNRVSPQNLTIKYHDLKNRLYMMEIELENERKKVNHEKENKAKTIADLKTRFEFEKKAALKALEAKLSAEKLEEFNKYKETAETEKANEIDYIIKKNETDLFNVKLKLREKSEKLVYLFIYTFIFSYFKQYICQYTQFCFFFLSNLDADFEDKNDAFLLFKFNSGKRNILD